MILRILYIDDDQDDHEIFEDALKEIHPDAKATYLLNAQNIQDDLKPPLPDIIFLDYNLPLVNGIECLKQIRSKREYDDIPIVFYSVHLDRAQDAYENGANSFIVKQVKMQKIKDSIHTILKRNWKDKETFKKFELIRREDQYWEDQ